MLIPRRPVAPKTLACCFSSAASRTVVEGGSDAERCLFDKTLGIGEQGIPDLRCASCMWGCFSPFVNGLVMVV